MRDKLAALNPNTLVEVSFYDHSSSNTWYTGKEELDIVELQLVLVGYYIGSTKKSYRFGMAYSLNSNRYVPTFTILKGTVIKWRKLQYPKGHYVKV